jgi:ferredoxin-fold anticodon binding domain-containing protein
LQKHYYKNTSAYQFKSGHTSYAGGCHSYIEKQNKLPGAGDRCEFKTICSQGSHVCILCALNRNQIILFSNSNDRGNKIQTQAQVSDVYHDPIAQQNHKQLSQNYIFAAIAT